MVEVNQIPVILKVNGLKNPIKMQRFFSDWEENLKSNQLYVISRGLTSDSNIWIDEKQSLESQVYHCQKKKDFMDFCFGFIFLEC